MENFLNSIRNNEDVFANLTALNDLLKNNESLRRETPVCFYSVIKQLLNDLIEEKEKLNEENGKTLELAIKCLRNSSAAIAETAFSDDETDICKLLLSYLKQNLNNDNLNIIQHNNKNNCSSISSSSSGSSIFVHVMQYFFNLSQGNQKASDLFLDDFVQVSFSVLNRSTQLDLIKVASMIVVFTNLNKNVCSNSSYIFSLKRFTELTAIVLRELGLNSLDLDELNSEKIQPNEFSFKLVYLYFDHLFSAENFSDDFNQLDLTERLHLLKLICLKLEKCEENIYFSSKCIEFLSKQFETSNYNYMKTKQYFNDAHSELESMNAFSNHLNEIKALAHCLSDLLVSEIGSKSLMDTAQASSYLFEITCNLLKETHENNHIKCLFEQSTVFPCYNLRIELVRLIGILVYNNPTNQRLLVEFKVLDLVASNLNIDLNNLFYREWSIVALKHILDKLDLK